jgi:phage terminase large subunit GpA-like protein
MSPNPESASRQIVQDIDENARRTIIKAIRLWKLSAYIEQPSEWAAANRYLPQGVSNLPGKINHEIAPHMVEIQDCFHPDTGIKSVSIMKSTQSLATTTIENVIGWAIKNKLHNILYIISSKGMAKMRSSAAIDVLIDYSGLSDYIKPISSRMKRKTADNTFYKEFAGGYRLMMTSWHSIADAKSFSWDLIIMDEIDEAPIELKGQGDPEKLFEVRGVTARHLKIAKISTPTPAKPAPETSQPDHYAPTPPGWRQ